MNQVEQLRLAWRNQNLIPFVGAGVSKGAAALPTWDELLEHGVRYLRANRKDLGLDEVKLERIASGLQEGSLPQRFGTLQDHLGGAPKSDHYEAFLNEQFAAPDILHTGTLEALAGLRPRTVVTTNYDRILEEFGVVRGGSYATWLQPERILSLLRADRGVIHLHGRYDEPESVILSATDYSRIVNRPESSKTVARTLFLSGVMMFVGTSLEGVGDPHLGALLEEFRELRGSWPERAAPHFILIRDSVPEVDKVRFRRYGVEPVSYGETFDDLPEFLRRIPDRDRIEVRVGAVRDRLYTLAHSRTVTEVLSDARTFIERVVFPNRTVRVAFAVKSEEEERIILRVVDPLPTMSTHNTFSYPQTLAAWALIEGRIFAYPADLERICDFEHLERIGKLDRVREALAAPQPSSDSMVSVYLDPDDIAERAKSGTLRIGDLYQDWVARQPKQHYRQFITVPVPIVEHVSNEDEPPEYCVINIDCQDEAPLLAADSEALLKLLSDVVSIRFVLHASQTQRA